MFLTLWVAVVCDFTTRAPPNPSAMTDNRLNVIRGMFILCVILSRFCIPFRLLVRETSIPECRPSSSPLRHPEPQGLRKRTASISTRPYFFIQIQTHAWTTMLDLSAHVVELLGSKFTAQANAIPGKHLPCQPQGISNGLENRPLTVGPQNAIPAEKGSWLHDRAPLTPSKYDFAGAR